MEEEALRLLPSMKKPAEVRTYWRAFTRQRLAAGLIQGLPTKENKKDKQLKIYGSQADDERYQLVLDSGNSDDEGTGVEKRQGQNSDSDMGSDSESQSQPSSHDADDFFQQ